MYACVRTNNANLDLLAYSCMLRTCFVQLSYHLINMCAQEIQRQLAQLQDQEHDMARAVESGDHDAAGAPAGGDHNTADAPAGNVTWSYVASAFVFIYV